MGCCKKTCTVTLAIIAAILGYAVHSLFEVPPVPELDQNQYWGPGKAPKSADTTIKPFKIEFKPERIENLKQKLTESAWFTEPLEGVGFQYGFNGKYLKEVVDFWKNKYDFAERQNYLNKYPQFKTNIQGLNIHFIHIKQTPVKGSRVIPILLLHGWPGSFVEFHKVISILTTQKKDSRYAFEIVVPSLPGYGYSQGSSKTGLGATHIAVIMRNLMKRLGYSKYSIQGGDWGAMITNAMAVMYPDDIYGYHTNMAFDDSTLGTLKLFLGSLYPPMLVEKEHISKMYPLTEKFQYLLEESGYLHLQATKPDTIGVSLNDSPVGLAAYIIEKFSTWTNKEWKSLPDGGLTKKYTLTELLDNIMIYWDSRCITTSMRLYAESFSKGHSNLKVGQIPVTVPTAVARFANELSFTSKCHLKGKFKNLVQVSDFEDGGHFAAFEQPEYLANDLISAVTAFEEYYTNKENQERMNK